MPLFASHCWFQHSARRFLIINPGMFFSWWAANLGSLGAVRVHLPPAVNYRMQQSKLVEGIPSFALARYVLMFLGWSISVCARSAYLSLLRCYAQGQPHNTLHIFCFPLPPTRSSVAGVGFSSRRTSPVRISIRPDGSSVGSPRLRGSILRRSQNNNVLMVCAGDRLRGPHPGGV